MKNIPELMIPGDYSGDSTGSIVRDTWAVASVEGIEYKVVSVNTQGMFLQYKFHVRENTLGRDYVVRTASTGQMDSRLRDIQRPDSSIAGDDSWMTPGTLLKVVKEFPAMATNGNNFLTVAAGSAILVLSRRNSTTLEFYDSKLTETRCSLIEFTSSEGLSYMVRVLDRLASDCFHHYFTILSEP
jgi:hypothetical protein